MAEQEHYRLIDDLLERALELEPDRRAAFLADACGEDATLKREVETLLEAHGRAGDFMASPAFELAARNIAGGVHSDLVGRTLGDYTILSFLGAGAMGEVYRASDPRLGREVAIKLLPPHLAEDSEAVLRFEREARAVAALSHPNILSIYDIGCVRGLHYAVMELLEGETLGAWLERARPTAQEALYIAVSVAQGLAAAHAKGIIHRDLKPENIFLTTDNRAKILDFGLARINRSSTKMAGPESASLTEAGTILGTLGYMSPEQVQGEPADAPSDIFSFGCLLYELITGRRAFARSSTAETIAAILRDPAPLLPDAGVNNVPGLQQVLSRCLEKNPQDRYSSAELLARDLQIVANEFARRPWFGRGSPRRLVLAVALLVLLAVPLAAIVAWWVMLPRPALADFQPRDWIVITEFENNTGDTIFDRSLDTALRICVAQSSHVNVLSASRVADALRRMRKAPIVRVDRQTGREIAQREQARLLLIPSITGFSGSYMLSASFEDPVTGNILGTEIVRVRNKEQVLDGLDRLARNSRRTMGESLAAISRNSRNLVRVTTASLEALRQYSLAVEKHWDVKLNEARVYYENALALDPGFTAAAASLGMMNYEYFDREKGKTLLSQAMMNLEGLTERESYRIRAFYARAVEDDLPKCVKLLEAFLALYPDDAAGNHNLGWFNSQLGKHAEAIRYYEEAIRIDPSLMHTYDNLNLLYLHTLGNASAAIEVCTRQLARNPQRLSAYDNLGWAYLGKGDLDRARNAFEKALEISPNATLDLWRLAHTLRLQHNYPKAVEVLKSIPVADPKESTDYDLGVIYQLMGDAGRARHHLAIFRSNVEKTLAVQPKNAISRVKLAIANFRLGIASQGETLGIRTDTRQDPEFHFVLANYFAVLNKPEKALEQVEILLQKGWRNYVWLKIHPDMMNLEREPRFQALLARLLK